MCQGVQNFNFVGVGYNGFLFTILNISVSQLKYVTFIQNQA